MNAGTDLSTLAIDIHNRSKVALLSDSNLRAQVDFFLDQGFVVLRGCVDPETVNSLKNRVATGFGGSLPCTYWDSDGNKKISLFSPDLIQKRELKILDAHAVDSIAQQAIFAPPIRTFLEAVFGTTPVAFQSLAFIKGSEQPAHDDRTFVPVHPPGNFIASWIALERIVTGSGELLYYPRSHLLPPHVFQNGTLSQWRPEELHNYSPTVVEKATRAGLSVDYFFAEAGDVLLWHSSLLHGGAPIKNPQLTRYSFVTHYCPTFSVPSHAKTARCQ
jgi:phytanoyl-CoA hydroxylase